ncbi:MAG: site-2 protease family protein [Thermoguttaceae bacterium]
MLIGEPARTQYDLNFVLFGIPVRIHPLFWLVALIFGANGRDGIGILTWVAAVFLSILLHELGHAWMMRLHGFRPWIVLYGMGGLTSYDPRQGFGVKRSDTLANVLISAAGPGIGFLLAAFLVAMFFATGHGDQLHFARPWLSFMCEMWPADTRFADLLNDIFFICVLWGLVNLLPIYPLDGGQIARELFVRFSPRDGIRQSMMLSIFAAIAMAAYGYVRMDSLYVALLFGYLAYASFIALQNYSGGSRW